MNATLQINFLTLVDTNNCKRIGIWMVLCIIMPYKENYIFLKSRNLLDNPLVLGKYQWILPLLFYSPCFFQRRTLTIIRRIDAICYILCRVTFHLLFRLWQIFKELIEVHGHLAFSSHCNIHVLQTQDMIRIFNTWRHETLRHGFNPVLVTCIKIGFRTTRYKSVPPYVQRQYCLSEPKKK